MDKKSDDQFGHILNTEHMSNRSNKNIFLYKLQKEISVSKVPMGKKL
jgi:hypothetical protein